MSPSRERKLLLFAASTLAFVRCFDEQRVSLLRELIHPLYYIGLFTMASPALDPARTITLHHRFIGHTLRRVSTLSTRTPCPATGTAVQRSPAAQADSSLILGSATYRLHIPLPQKATSGPESPPERLSRPKGPCSACWQSLSRQQQIPWSDHPFVASSHLAIPQPDLHARTRPRDFHDEALDTPDHQMR